MEHLGVVVCLFAILFGANRDLYAYANDSSVSTPAICGGLLNSSTGIVMSPNHPQQYLPNALCEWIIEDPNKHQIVLITETFNTEPQTTCAYDYLQIRDGSATSPLLGTYCGTNGPPKITSSGYQLYLKFRTDGSNNAPGFRLAWGSAIIGSYATSCATQIHGGHFYSLNGVITSPNYPQNYPPGLNRQWIIEIPKHHLVVLNVTKFHLESNSGCGNDYLEIRNGSSAEASILTIGKYCGTVIPQRIVGTGDRVYLRFKSDGSVAYEGFFIEWDSTNLDCGGNLTASLGSMTSPNYPAPFSSFGECNWNIRVSAGSIIQFVLVDLEFAATEHCRFDFIEIYEGSDRDGKKLGSYCQSTNHPLYVETSTNVASVRFRSDRTTVPTKRFRIIYHTICRNRLHGSKGSIESLNFPDKYPDKENCSWIIEAPTGHTLNLTFSHFDLNGGHGNLCDEDYLEITEGNDDKPNRKIGKFCNSTAPPPTIRSTQRQVFVKFYSNDFLSGNGFRLEWAASALPEVRKSSGTHQKQLLSQGHSSRTISALIFISFIVRVSM